MIDVIATCLAGLLPLALIPVWRRLGLWGELREPTHSETADIVATAQREEIDRRVSELVEQLQNRIVKVEDRMSESEFSSRRLAIEGILQSGFYSTLIQGAIISRLLSPEPVPNLSELYAAHRVRSTDPNDSWSHRRSLFYRDAAAFLYKDLRGAKPWIFLYDSPSVLDTWVRTVTALRFLPTHSQTSKESEVTRAQRTIGRVSRRDG